MVEITDIDKFRDRKFKEAEAEYTHYMQLAEELEAKGKNKFALQLLAKAKAARKMMTKYRKLSHNNRSRFIPIAPNSFLLDGPVTVTTHDGFTFTSVDELFKFYEKHPVQLPDFNNDDSPDCA